MSAKAITTLPANSPDLGKAYNAAAKDCEEAGNRLSTGADRLPDDAPWKDVLREKADELAALAGRLRAYAARP